MNNIQFKLVLFIMLIMSSVQILAQDEIPDTMSYRNLGEVIVSANRLSVPLKSNPGAVSLVNTPILQTMPRSIAADEALRLVPGVRIDNQANGSRIHMSIRGQGILSERGLRGIKVLIDGIPVNDPSGFAADLYDIDWNSVGKIEVLRGPSASLYGGGANAGILNISTQEPGVEPLNAQISAIYGSNGFHKIYGSADGTSDKLKYRISVSEFKGNGYRLHQAFYGGIGSGLITWQPRENIKISEIFTFSNYLNQNAEGLNISQLSDPRQANPDAIPCNEYQYTRRITNGINSEIRFSKNQQINLMGFMRMTDYKEPGSSAVQYRKLFASGASLQYRITSEAGMVRNHFSAGAEIQIQNIDEYKVPNIKIAGRNERVGDIRKAVVEDTILLANQFVFQNSAGIFIVDRIEIGKKFNTIFSARYDNLSNQLNDKMRRFVNLSGNADFNNLTARLGFDYEFKPAINIYANVGQGYLPPATEELMNNPASFGGFNIDLKPSTSLGEEIGLRGYAFHSLYYDFTFFHLDTKDDFYRYRITTRPLETFYGNMGSSKRDGFEAYTNWYPTQNISIQLAYTWSIFRYSSPDSIKNQVLPNSPEHQLYGDASYRFARHLEVGIGCEMQSKWYIYTDKIHSNVYQDGFFLYNARISCDFKISHVKVIASVFMKNLNDTQYIAFTEPDPDGNSYQPAARREIFFSLRFRF
jgi:iron complex outermembrane recepter protein